MKKQVSNDQIEREIEAGYKPLAIESGIAILPLSDLSDREFELLVYCLIKQEIEERKHPPYTDISLMQGVSERGRDCVLYSKERVAGLVQCKKYHGRLSKPQVIKEILKFLMFSLLDKSILPEPESFEYKIYASNDFSEPAVNLIYAYKDEIEKEIASGKICEYLRGVIEDYESFSGYKNSPPLNEIEKLLKLIKVSSSNATDITMRIYNYDFVLSSFFNIKTVVSIQAADKIVRTALNDYGLKLLTDNDLHDLQKRIGNTSKENRINLGYVDFFGFNIEFFKFLKGKRFEDVLKAVMSLQSILHRELLSFVNAETNKLIFSYITVPLLFQGKIHSFSVGVAAPYLFDRILPKISDGSIPKILLTEYFPKSNISKEELIAKTAEILFESSERVMKGDYTHLVGNADEVRLKKKIYAHMHKGFSTIQDARVVFKKDIELIRPVLDQIEEQLSRLISKEQTIIIKDFDFFENKDDIKKIFDTLKVIEDVNNKQSS